MLEPPPLGSRATLPAVSPRERFWPSRLRWRLRGAMQWPAFVVLTLVDGAVMDRLPPVATTGLNLIEGVLIATFANLFLVGAVAPWLARRLADRRAAALATAAAPPPTEAERDVIQDRTATALLVVGLAAVIASGLANRPVIVSETEATEAAGRAVLDYVHASGNEELQRNVETANILKQGDDYFRVCIARDDRERFFCLLVDTDRRPPKVTKDPSAESNEAFRGGLSPDGREIRSTRAGAATGRRRSRRPRRGCGRGGSSARAPSRRSSRRRVAGPPSAGAGGS